MVFNLKCIRHVGEQDLVFSIDFSIKILLVSGPQDVSWQGMFRNHLVPHMIGHCYIITFYINLIMCCLFIYLATNLLGIFVGMCLYWRGI